MLYEEEKVWGSGRHIFGSARAAVSLLNVKSGFCCSRHYHKSRVNQFTALSCTVSIQWWMPENLNFDSPYPQYEEIILRPGQTYAIEAGIVHRFTVLRSGELLEVYWSKDLDSVVSINDIVRLDTGGPDGTT